MNVIYSLFIVAAAMFLLALCVVALGIVFEALAMLRRSVRYFRTVNKQDREGEKK